METPYETWLPAVVAWDAFVERHPELNQRPGQYAFYNFTRRMRNALVDADAIRMVGKHYIAQPERFEQSAFALLTGGPLRRINDREVA